MFQQLALENLPALAPIFNYSHRLTMVISSILAGNSSACLYRAARGELYLLWDRGNNVFYTSSNDPPCGWEDAVGDLLHASIIPQFASRGEEHFSIDVPDSPAMYERLRTAFSPYLKRELQTLFLAHPGPSELAEQPHHISGADFVPVDGKLLCGEGPANWEILRSEVLYMWPSVQRFLAHGWGTAAVLEGRIAGWCTAEYVSPQQLGIGIETEPNMRRRGIATGAGAAFLKQCWQHKRRPHWECNAANESSVRLAKKLGFRLLERRTRMSGLFPSSSRN